MRGLGSSPRSAGRRGGSGSLGSSASNASYARVHTEEEGLGLGAEGEGEDWAAYDRGLDDGEVELRGGGRGRGGRSGLNMV